MNLTGMADALEVQHSYAPRFYFVSRSPYGAPSKRTPASLCVAFGH